MMTEFAAAFTVFICCLLVPMINVSVIPLRYVIAFAMVQEMTHKLAKCETRGQAIKQANEIVNSQDFAQRFGVTIGTSDLAILCKGQNGDLAVFQEANPLPPTWLPGGQRSQCNYLLQVQTPVDIPPLFCGGPKITALTAPIKLNIVTTAPWENLGCDPATQKFYINE